MRTLLLAVLVACGGGSKSSPPPISNQAPPPADRPMVAESTDTPPAPCTEDSELAKCAVATMEYYSNRMCACKDKACADSVNERLAKWGNELAKMPGAAKSDKPDPELAKRSGEIMTRYTECMTKLLMNEPPPTDPCGGGGNPCG